MDTREYLKNRIAELQRGIDAVQAALNAFDRYNSGETENFEDNSTVFTSKINVKIPKDGSWIEKIVFVIKDRNRFLHNSEIAEALVPFYPDKTEKDIKRRISAVISDAVAKNKVEGLINYKFSNSIKDTVWGKKDWLNEDGEILPEFMYFKKNKTKESIKISL